MLALHTIALPALLWRRARVMRLKDYGGDAALERRAATARQRCGWLVARYRPQAWYFEFGTLLLRLAMGVVVVFVG